MEKKMSGEELTEEEEAKLDDMKSKFRKWGKKWHKGWKHGHFGR
jgi:hypothetical protein